MRFLGKRSGLTRRALALLGVALAGGAMVVGVNTGSASATTILGGIDLAWACEYQGGPGWQPVVTGGTVYDWRCELSGDPVQVGTLDMNRACFSQYWTVARDARPGFSDVNNPYSWYCYV